MAMCPVDNIEPGQRPLWDKPTDCKIPCVDPVPAPMGYEKCGDDWWCADGFYGKVDQSCVDQPTLDDDCTARPWRLSGCVPKEFEGRNPVPSANEGTSVCLAPQLAYAVSSGSCESMRPGELCTARCLRGCTVGCSLLFGCPMGNQDPNRLPDLVKGDCKASCEVCGVAPFTDTDGSAGVVSGYVAFGPAHVEGLMAEHPVDSYAVYFADSCGVKLGEALQVIPKGVQLHYCCRLDSYVAKLEGVEKPEQAAQIVVVVRTRQGEMPTGMAVELVEPAARHRTGAGCRAAVPALLLGGGFGRWALWCGVIAAVVAAALESERPYV